MSNTTVEIEQEKIIETLEFEIKQLKTERDDWIKKEAQIRYILNSASRDIVDEVYKLKKIIDLLQPKEQGK